MKRIICITALLVGVFASPPVSWAQEGEVDDVDPVPAPTLFLGGYLGFGLTTMLGNGDEFYAGLGNWPEEMGKDGRTPKFTGGGGAYVDYYFSEDWDMWAVEGGIGLTSKGFRYKGTGDEGEFKAKLKVLYMDFPIMAKVNLQKFQISFGVVLSVALSGVETNSSGSSKIVERWGNQDWRPWNRVNFGPKVAFGYGIPVGPVVVVPGITWAMHLVDELNDKEIEAVYDDNRSLSFRAMNVMFNAGVEWGFY